MPALYVNTAFRRHIRGLHQHHAIARNQKNARDLTRASSVKQNIFSGAPYKYICGTEQAR